ncbi:30S ribosomal protein S18 [bacterium]|nr:30S ribosomal protein S18 [bacterium]MBG98225.1 30S ribosomal protein S18 [bacterium]MBT02263.1 30S ribosomal protein S18 [bacterium]|tara:strand:+ start:75 stop:383 length:309 start_codon:yes stop_codon:yes gene_type:complete
MPRITHPLRELKKKKEREKKKSLRSFRKKSYFKLNESLDYKNLATLKPFLNQKWSIKPRKQTRLSRRDHALVVKTIKRAREMAILPYYQHHDEYGLNVGYRR